MTGVTLCDYIQCSVYSRAVNWDKGNFSPKISDSPLNLYATQLLLYTSSV